MSALNELLQTDWKSINYRQGFSMALRVVSNLQIASFILLLIFILFQCYDSGLQGNLKKIHQKSKQAEQLNKQLEEKKMEKRRFDQLMSQVEKFPVEIIELEAGKSAKLVALAESQTITSIAKGELNNVDDQLPTVAEARQFVSMTPTKEEQIDLVELEKKKNGQPIAQGSKNPADKPVVVNKFSYELKVKGTYAAIVDLINHLVLLKQCVSIDSLEIKSDDKAPPVTDPKDNPNFPVQVMMTATLSFYVYDPASQAI
jgi:Tfp pilus assembly protein PilO